MEPIELAMLQLAAAWLCSLALSADILTKSMELPFMADSMRCLDYNLLAICDSQARSALPSGLKIFAL